MLKLAGIFLLITHFTSSAEIRFEDVTEKAGLIDPLKGIIGHGGAFGDVDGDGLADLYVGGFADRPDGEYRPADGPMPNVLLRNLGGLKFEAWKQDAVELHARTSGAVFADLDNDGWPDLYFSTAWMDDDGAVEPLIYPNTGAKGGIPVFTATRKSRSGDKIVYYPAGPTCDVDGDGRTDIFVINWFRGNHSRLLRNVSDAGNRLDIPNGKTRRIESVKEINQLMTIRE